MKFTAVATLAVLAVASAAPEEQHHQKHRSVLRAKDRLLEKIHHERQMKEGMDGEVDHQKDRQVLDADEFAAFLQANEAKPEQRRDQETYGNYG